jgi:glutaminyl-tRNA synthetase
MDTAENENWHDFFNPDSLQILTDCYVEPSLLNAKPGERFQFERVGYFNLDPEDTSGDHLVFNRTVTLRDTWAKIEKKLTG